MNIIELQLCQLDKLHTCLCNETRHVPSVHLGVLGEDGEITFCPTSQC